MIFFSTSTYKCKNNTCIWRLVHPESRDNKKSCLFLSCFGISILLAILRTWDKRRKQEIILTLVIYTAAIHNSVLYIERDQSLFSRLLNKTELLEWHATWPFQVSPAVFNVFKGSTLACVSCWQGSFSW